jgi:hypothetical protein
MRLCDQALDRHGDAADPVFDGDRSVRRPFGAKRQPERDCLDDAFGAFARVLHGSPARVQVSDSVRMVRTAGGRRAVAAATDVVERVPLVTVATVRGPWGHRGVVEPLEVLAFVTPDVTLRRCGWPQGPKT